MNIWFRGPIYITMTCHFIESNWEVESYCLQSHYLPEDHAAVNISEVLAETFQQWKFEENR